MLEKDREARRNDSGLTQNKFVDILFALLEIHACSNPRPTNQKCNYILGT